MVEYRDPAPNLLDRSLSDIWRRFKIQMKRPIGEYPAWVIFLLAAVSLWLLADNISVDVYKHLSGLKACLPVQ